MRLTRNREVFVTGSGRMQDRSLCVPHLPRAIAESAAAGRAGAAMVHLHVRDPETGAPSRDASLLAGGTVRVGIGSTLWLGKSERATNEGLVEWVVGIVEGLGAQVLGPAEVKKRLGLVRREAGA